MSTEKLSDTNGDKANPTGAFKPPQYMGEALEQFAKLKLNYEGGAGLEEFINKFEVHSDSYGWSPPDKYVCLTLALRGQAYQVLSDLPEGTKPDQGYSLLLRALRERFGETPLDNLTTLVSSRLGDFNSATEYTQKMQAATRQLFNGQDDAVNELLRLSVFRGLPRDHASTTALRPMALARGTAASKLVDAVRVHFHDADHKGHIVAAVTKASTGRGGCLICGRNNHETEKCFHLGAARRSIEKVCPYIVSILQAAVPLVLLPQENLICLVDTGAECTMATEQATKRINKGRIEKSGPKTLLTVGGKETVLETRTLNTNLTNININILVLNVPYLLHVGAVPVDLILGQDWLKANCPVSFDLVNGALLLRQIQGLDVPIVETPFQAGHTWQKDIHDVLRVVATVDNTPYDRVVLDTITFSDFAACKVACRGQVYWEASWTWIGAEPQQKAFRPGSYKGQMASITLAQKEQYLAEIQKWKDLGFISQVKRHELMRTITLMAVAQDHKETTPCRPVMDCQPLNSLLVSSPNEDGQVTCADAIRRWRTVHRDADGKEKQWVLIDIKKAYLQVRMTPECTRHLGLQLENESTGETEFWRMDRLPFGLNISPKVLRTILRHILREHKLDAEVDVYVDDAKVWTQDIETVRAALAANGFEIKDPEPAEEARVLGLQRVPGQRWKRRAQIPTAVGKTYTDLRSWAAIVACAHYPVLRWLRPAVRYLERLGRVATTQAGTDVLPENVCMRWANLIRTITEAGDPTGGRFMVDATLPWTLYTDASNIGLGGALYFGTELVEDVSWLRKIGDVRPIDTVELEAVLKSMNSLVVPWMRALGLKSLKLKLYVDNQPVVGQINRRKASHSVRPSGYTQGVAEARLQTIEELIQLYSIELDCSYVPSGDNKADHLTRIPSFLVDASLKGTSEVLDPDTDVVATVVIPKLTPAHQSRLTLTDVANATDREAIKAIVRQVHDHEGALALYNRLRRWFKPVVGLVNICREVVRECTVCRQYKTQAFQNADELTKYGSKRKRQNKATRHKATVPFNKVHVDVVGNFRVDAGAKNFFALTLVDSASGYGMALPSKLAPSSADVVCLLQHLVDVYHTTPLVVVSDGGSIFTSEETAYFLDTNGIQLQTTAKHSSTSNGKVERFHRTLEEYLRTHVRGEKVGWYTFTQLLKRAVNHHNVTPFDGESAHEKVFTFPPIDPAQPTELRDEFTELRVDNRELWPLGFAEGSPVLVRNFKRDHKLAPYWLPAVVAERVGPLTYKLRDMAGKFALKDLKSDVHSTVHPQEEGVERARLPAASEAIS